MISNQSIDPGTKNWPENDFLLPEIDSHSSLVDKPENTSTEEFNEFLAGDNTLCIVGYVDSIIGTKTVGRERSLNLFKFTMNNADSCGVTVPIWEDQISKYTSLVKFCEIIQMMIVKSLPLDRLYDKREEGFVNSDLSVQRNTVLNFFGLASEPFIWPEKLMQSN
ncbi:uncharacterized protein LOC125501889 [Athalia rosae]|uniref:uncharacterized protein LOC125501889 n=1 Tax=Athalia rosae TaxID=37344 RepID=UPI0020339EB3|nr:uncharacterized protein LOC125501889 [Athalia rosae]